MTITKEAVLAALGKVQEPDLGQDLVTLNMIRNLEIDGDKVSFAIMLTTPACPFRGKIEKDAKAAVATVAGVKSVEVKMTRMCQMMAACVDWSTCLSAMRLRSALVRVALESPLFL